MRPVFRFLDDSLIEKIVSEARDVLDRVGVLIQNPAVVDLLAGHGARVENGRTFLPGSLIDRCLKTSPKSFKLHDVLGNQTHDFRDNQVYFTPGSAALHLLEYPSMKMVKAVTRDYINYVKLVNGLANIASQSTAMISSDVHEAISDSYRLYLSLVYGEKPVVTGAFSIEAFEVMKDLQLIVRGSEAALREKPLAVFSCCPTSPLKWSKVTSQNVVDCAKYSIPVEFIAMPLSGFMAPVTLVGTLVQHTAETLSGVVISQCASPGTPMLYGGSPAIFDVRYETTPMGAIETMMIDCAYNEIGKSFGLPTQAYIGLSDAKQLDAQAGFESGIGSTLAALSGINNISGPGMLDFESCQSLEKLVVDNEICGMALRAARGIEPREDFPSLDRFRELLAEDHLLISSHTRKYLKQEHYFPGPSVTRSNLSRWKEEGSVSMWDRAHAEVEQIISRYRPSALSEEAKKGLTSRMLAEARKFGMEKLPG